MYGIGICAECGGSAFRPHTGGMFCIYVVFDLCIVAFVIRCC